MTRIAKMKSVARGGKQIIPLWRATTRRCAHRLQADQRLGRFEEDKFRAGYHRNPGAGKTRSIHFTLLGGRKVRSQPEFVEYHTDAQMKANCEDPFENLADTSVYPDTPAD